MKLPALGGVDCSFVSVGAEARFHLRLVMTVNYGSGDDGFSFLHVDDIVKTVPLLNPLFSFINFEIHDSISYYLWTTANSVFKFLHQGLSHCRSPAKDSFKML